MKKTTTAVLTNFDKFEKILDKCISSNGSAGGGGGLGV
jgi:hypothetical protein